MSSCLSDGGSYFAMKMQRCPNGVEWLSLRQQVLFVMKNATLPKGRQSPCTETIFFAIQREVQILFFISIISRTTVDVDDDDKNSSNDDTITVT